MLKLKSIKYDLRDLINLLKNNTGLIANCNPKDLFVDIKVRNNKLLECSVRRLDNQDIEI